MIPAEAVEALARVLANEELFRADCEGYGWDAEKDSSDHFMPTARVEATRILEAAAPYMLADAWDRGHHDGAVDQMLHMENDGAKTTPNPYRPTNAD